MGPLHAAAAALAAALLGGRRCRAQDSASCSIDDQLVAAAIEKVHGNIVKTLNLCTSFHSDVYQRFSGYVAKYRVSGFCEGALAIFDGMQRLVSSHVRLSEECAREKSVGSQVALEIVDALGRHGVALGKLLSDVNAAGDGSFAPALASHLDMLADNIVKVQELSLSPEGQRQDGPRLPSVVASLSDSLQHLCSLVLEQVQDSVTYNVASLSVADLPRFLKLLGSFPAAIPVDLTRGGDAGAVCKDIPMIYRPEHVVDPIVDPPSWRNRDVSGVTSPRPSVQKILFTLAKMVPLSYNFIAIAPRAQVGSQELTSEYKNMFHDTGGASASSSQWLAAAGKAAELACNGTGLAYSPADCLFDLGWGSMTFSLSTEPPFDGVFAVAEASQKGSQRPQAFVQPVANGTASMESLFDSVDSVYKSLNTPSPDLLFLSPMVGNCMSVRLLGRSRRGAAGAGPPQITPKLVWLPVNPLIPPPWQLEPDFSAWHRRWVDAQREDQEAARARWRDAQWWFAQCSLASAAAVMEEQGYVLLHLEHSFAVFVLRSLWPAVAPMVQETVQHGMGGPGGRPLAAGAGAAPLYDHWLRGWFCSPVAPTLFGLRHSSAVDLSVLHDRRAPPERQQRAVCAFAREQGLPAGQDLPAACEGGGAGAPEREAGAAGARRRHPQSWRSWELQDPPEERGKSFVLEAGRRGRCLPSLGVCECFPPYRGRFCEDSEPGSKDASRKYRAVLHYLVGDREKLLSDFTRTLPLLWERFNEKFDYPVVVFHDGLSSISRQRILEASSNRVWFAYVEDYASVPAYLKGKLEMELGGYGLGYRGMCRFRSGPMFTQPVMTHFDYAWTLDTDGYFPAGIQSDPFEIMWRKGLVYGYSHVSRDQASAVQHFWEFCRLYFETKGLDPKSTPMMRRITDALVLRDTYWHEWNRVLFMNDIEITQLSWFRGDQYQDFFRYLDSVGGFWLYRWGDHAVRTIALALFLDQDKLLKMGVPYGHQNTCRCGDEHPDKVCVRTNASDWWQCLPASEAQLVAGGKEVASGDIGTVHEGILFGGL